MGGCAAKPEKPGHREQQEGPGKGPIQVTGGGQPSAAAGSSARDPAAQSAPHESPLAALMGQGVAAVVAPQPQAERLEPAGIEAAAPAVSLQPAVPPQPAAPQRQQPPQAAPSSRIITPSSSAGDARAAQQARRAQLAQRGTSAASSAERSQSVASTVSLSQVPGVMTADGGEEAPPVGVKPEEILRAFYREVDPNRPNLEKAIRQVANEVESGKANLDKRCRALKKQYGCHPYAVWRKSNCAVEAAPFRADSRSVSTASVDTRAKPQLQLWHDSSDRHVSVLPDQEESMQQYYANGGEEPELAWFYSVHRVLLSDRRESKRIEADRQWRLMQLQEKEADQKKLKQMRVWLQWNRLVHLCRLSAIRHRERNREPDEPARRSRPALARSDGSRGSRNSDAASAGNGNSASSGATVAADEQTHRAVGGNAHTNANDNGVASRGATFEGLDSSGEIDNFDEVEKVAYIAKGASGAVYKAKWQGMFCAVKVFEYNHSDPDVLEAFYQEVNILKNTLHENLVRFYGFGATPAPFIVTEFLLGNLSDLLYGKRSRPAGGGPMLEMTDKRQVLISLGVANGLAFLHRKGICHRDLKSPNVLYNRDLYIKLCDFAFSKFKSKIADETLKFESRVGTPAWMAPEILRGEEYTLSADVHSYGVIMWEMVTRSEPFKGVNAYAIAHQVGNDGRRLEIPSECPQFWRQLMLRCWADPADRPSSAEVVLMLQKLRTDIANGKTIAGGAGISQLELETEPEPEPEPESESAPEPEPEPEPE
jgi:predicted Ser/Thr protein kinase